MSLPVAKYIYTKLHHTVIGIFTVNIVFIFTFPFTSGVGLFHVNAKDRVVKFEDMESLHVFRFVDPKPGVCQYMPNLVCFNTFQIWYASIHAKFGVLKTFCICGFDIFPSSDMMLKENLLLLFKLARGSILCQQGNPQF